MHSRRRQKEGGDDRDEKQDEACEAEALRVRIRFLLRKAVGMRLDRFIIRIRNQSPVVGRKVLRIRRRFLLEEPEDRRQEGEVILLGNRRETFRAQGPSVHGRRPASSPRPLWQSCRRIHGDCPFPFSVYEEDLCRKEIPAASQPGFGRGPG